MISVYWIYITIVFVFLLFALVSYDFRKKNRLLKLVQKESKRQRVRFEVTGAIKNFERRKEVQKYLPLIEKFIKHSGVISSKIHMKFLKEKGLRILEFSFEGSRLLQVLETNEELAKIVYGFDSLIKKDKGRHDFHVGLNNYGSVVRQTMSLTIPLN